MERLFVFLNGVWNRTPPDRRLGLALLLMSVNFIAMGAASMASTLGLLAVGLLKFGPQRTAIAAPWLAGPILLSDAVYKWPIEGDFPAQEWLLGFLGVLLLTAAAHDLWRRFAHGHSAS